MIRWFKHWRHRRDIIRCLIAYAKTPEGRTYIEAINQNNLIMADYEAEILGAEPTVKTGIPAKHYPEGNQPIDLRPGAINYIR